MARGEGKSVSPGELRSVATLEHKQHSGDSGGGQDISWVQDSDDPKVRVKVMPLNTTEQFFAAQEGGGATHWVYTWAAPDITRGDRLTLDDGRQLTVQGRERMAGRDRMVKLRCVRDVD